MRILTALTIYAETGEGDVKALEGKFTGCVLAAGGCDSEERKASSTCWRSKIAARLTEAHRISLEFTDTYLSCQPA